MGLPMYISLWDCPIQLYLPPTSKVDRSSILLHTHLSGQYPLQVSHLREYNIFTALGICRYPLMCGRPNWIRTSDQ